MLINTIILVQRMLDHHLDVSRCFLGPGGTVTVSCWPCFSQPESKRDRACGEASNAEGRSSRIRLHQVSNPVCPW